MDDLCPALMMRMREKSPTRAMKNMMTRPPKIPAERKTNGMPGQEGHEKNQNVSEGRGFESRCRPKSYVREKPFKLCKQE